MCFYWTICHQKILDTGNASKIPLDISNEANTREASETPEAPETPEMPVAPNPTNSDLLKEILSLKGDMAKQSTVMLKAINDIKGIYSYTLKESMRRRSESHKQKMM